MKIRNATKKDIKSAIKIAKSLLNWFTKKAIKNMEIDFNMNNIVIASEKDEILGFLCFNSDKSRIKIVWLGVDKRYHRKGIGSKLIKWLGIFAKKSGVKTIETTTSTERL